MLAFGVVGSVMIVIAGLVPAMVIMPSIAMLAVAVITVMRRLEVGQIIQLGGGHQTFVRITHASEILGSWLDVQLAQHSIAADISMLFRDGGFRIGNVAEFDGIARAS